MSYTGYNVVAIKINEQTDVLGNIEAITEPPVTPTAYEISDLFATDINGKLFGYSAVSIVAHAPAEHMIEGEEYVAEI